MVLWTCQVCGYEQEGLKPKKCPECGADSENFSSEEEEYPAEEGIEPELPFEEEESDEEQEE